MIAPAISRFRRTVRCHLSLMGATLGALVLGAAPGFGVDYPYASPATFSALNTGTTTSFNLGDISVTATRLSTFSGSNGLTLGSEVIIFPATSPSNPPWVAGTRDMFRLRFNDSGNTTGDGTVTVQYAFSSPLPTSSFLIFADFDVKETMRIQAYDASSNLIDFASFSFARENGRDPTGASLLTPTWSGSSGYSGVLAYGTGASFSGSDPVVTLQSSTAISRLVYESDNNPYGTVNNNDLYFNFTYPIPEIDPASSGSAAALVTGVLGLLERRRKARLA